MTSLTGIALPILSFVLLTAVGLELTPADLERVRAQATYFLTEVPLMRW